MENKTLIWVFLSVLLYAGRSEQYACRDSEECSCWQMPGEEYELRCPKDSQSTFVIGVKSRRRASVNCFMRSSWSDFRIQSTGPVENVTLFFFQGCLLPNSTLRDITHKIGVQPTKRLRFESYKNLSSSLERRHLSGFPQLERLSLSSNGLTNLPGDLLQDLPELNTLELRENHVVLPTEFFTPVPKLRTLELGSNKLTHIDPKLFQSLEKLNFLGLWGNDLTTIEEHTFDKLTALSTLEISTNKLVTLPQDLFKHLPKLTNLQLNLNSFSTLPGGLLSRNQNLIKFGLSRNFGDMTSLPSRFFGNLSSIKEVQLRDNRLTALPEDIFWGSTSLRNLTLRGNLLTNLPENIFNESQNLGTLDLSSNRFSDFPDGLFKTLNKLEKLELQNNNLTVIQRDLFMGLSELKEVNLERNGIRNVDPLIFHPLTALEIVRLSYNKINFGGMMRGISNINFGPISPFSSCINLKEIHLAHNNINTFFFDWVLFLKLHLLDLSYNAISYIEAAQLHFISDDLTVDMRHNNISHINLEIAELIASQNVSDSKNVRIFIEGNPIVCDCFLYHFSIYLEGGMHPNVQKLFRVIPGQLRCAGPESMNQTLVSDLNSKNLECSFNDCPEKCKCAFRPSDRTVIANCAYRNLSIAPGRISAPEGVQIEVDLTGNILTEMPTFNQSGQADITRLLLSHNRISSISAEAVRPSLETLELNNNNLTRWNTTVLELLNDSTSLTKLTLHGNPWECNCETREFLSFVKTQFSKIPNILNVTCAVSEKSLLKMTTDELCPVVCS